MLETVLGIFLTFVLGLVAWLVKRERFALAYAIDEYGPIPHEKGQGRIFRV